MLQNELNKYSTNKSLGELIQTAMEKFDFSLENIFKVGCVVGPEGECEINTNDIIKIDKLTGMFAYVCRDALNYCGLIKDGKNDEKYDTISALYEMDRLKKYYDATIKKIKEIILFYYKGRTVVDIQ